MDASLMSMSKLPKAKRSNLVPEGTRTKPLQLLGDTVLWGFNFCGEGTIRSTELIGTLIEKSERFTVLSYSKCLFCCCRPFTGIQKNFEFETNSLD